VETTLDVQERAKDMNYDEQHITVK